MSSHSDRYMPVAERITAPSIILMNPKFPHNVGMTLRVAACYCIPQVVVTGKRIVHATDELQRVPREERLRGYAHVELQRSDDPFRLLEPDVIPVAVEFRPQSENLHVFEHPERAVYIFGPEDGTLDRSILTRCHRFVKMDTAECLNLSIAVATVLYDREHKAFWNRKQETPR